MDMRTRKVAVTEGVIAGTLFGTAAIFIRLMQSADAFYIAFWRLIIACAVLTAILAVARKLSYLNNVKGRIKDLLPLGIFLGLHLIFFVSAVKDTTILNATVLVNTTPIFSMIVSNFAFKLKPSRLAILGLAISFIGVCVIGYAESTNVTQSNASLVGTPSLKGDLEATLAAVVEAFYLNYGRKTRSQMSLLSIMIPIYLFAAFTVGVLSFPAGGKITTLTIDPNVLLPLLGLGILPTAIAHSLYFSSLSNLKSFETATMALLEPIGATILGIIVFAEIPDRWFVFGAALTVFGVFFVARERLRK
jgi:drug/metabolite transporter (DMT)-like permease